MGERKRQEMLAAQKEGGKKSSGPAMDARKEMSKSKEQVEEEMKISLSIRIKPLALDEMDSEELKNKANQIWNTIVSLETDKYDYEQRQLDQDYEFKELAERQRPPRRNTRRKRRITRRKRKRSKLKAVPNFHHHLLLLKSKSYPCNKRHSIRVIASIPRGSPGYHLPRELHNLQFVIAICLETRQVPVRICYALKIRSPKKKKR